MKVFEISRRHHEAAQLLAEGDLDDAEIAGRCGIARQTLWEWKKRPEFATLVDEHLARFRDEAVRLGLADLHRRVGALNDRWNRLQRIIEKRAADPAYAEAAGGTTGLLVRTVKVVGSGKNAREVHEFAVDTGLLRELREIERQAAQELGRWVERADVAHALKSYEVANSPNGL